ncbi:testis-specific gene A8 protein-like [Sipha flava]|uniref:Testis-specific gene A8 protein-like n=1 Tax=Sipha flava TaxID=143950 RepID=A0A8B8FA52_9HEMI|nr:testis-specific gene A8 protein-like [Sipha flava]
MQFQVSFALLAMVVCFAAAAEEAKPQSATSATDRSKRGLIAPLVASPYVAAPYAAAPYVAAPYAAAPYAVASPYAAATPYAIASPYATPYVSSYTSYPYVAKALASPYTYYP